MNNEVLNAIKTRRTIRKFTEEPVSHEVIEKIVEASAYAPSWKNTQTARYIIIEETALKNKIAKEAVMGFEWNTGIILGAPVLSALIAIGHPAIQPTAPARKPVQELIQYR